ncbi:MAG: hypothetical protein QOJ19_2144 [Acidimicrobiia bacterium]|nr:hypothetical protein [Acidimicrobiia bacterium]
MKIRRALVLLMAAVLLAIPAQAGAQGGNGVIRVSVTFNGQPLNNIAVIINNSAVNPNAWNNYNGQNFTNAQGLYEVAVPPGLYDVHVGEWPNTNATYGAQLLYEVSVGAGATVGLPFALDQGGGAITGVVRNGAGQPVPGIKVEAFGSWAAGDGPPYGWGDAWTDGNGAYTIPRLRPNGWYVVFASALGYRMDRVPVVNGAVTPGVDLPNANYAGPGPQGGRVPGAFPPGSLPTLGGDVPVVGDWDGNRTTTLGVRRGLTFYLSNKNSTGVADVAVAYGNPESLPLAGDWDGNGTSTIGVWQDGKFLLSNSASSSSADVVIPFGNPDDIPIVGDWDGNGTTTIGVWRRGTFFLRNSNTPGDAQTAISFGDASDIPIVGDWNGDGTATIGVHRENRNYLKNANVQAGDAEAVVMFGDVNDIPLVGDFDGNRTSTMAVRRGITFYISNTNAPAAPTDGVALYGDSTTVG